MAKTVPLILFAVMLWLTHGTIQRWQSDRRLWDLALVMAPAKPRVLLNAGVAHSDTGDWIGACPLLAKAATGAIRPSDEWGATVHMAAVIDLTTLRRVVACP